MATEKETVTVEKHPKTFLLELTPVEANALLAVVGTALEIDDSDVIDRDDRAPCEWAMERLSKLMKERQAMDFHRG